MIPLGTVAVAWECCECSLPSYLPFLLHFFTECKLPTFCCVLKLSTPFLFAQKENPPPTRGADALSYLLSSSHFVLTLVGLQVSSLPRMAKVNLKHKLFFEIWWPCLIHIILKVCSKIFLLHTTSFICDDHYVTDEQAKNSRHYVSTFLKLPILILNPNIFAYFQVKNLNNS